MGQASPPIVWQGLRISGSPLTSVGPVLLTGEGVSTRIRIETVTDATRKGRLAFTWTVGDQVSTPLVATFDLTNVRAADFLIPDWRPTRTGNAELRVHLYIARVAGTVESNLDEPAERYGALATGARCEMYTLYSASVRDANEWKAEQSWQAEQRSRTRLLIILAGAAAVAGFATVILIVFHV